MDASDVEVLGYESESGEDEDEALEGENENGDEEDDYDEVGGYEKKEYYGADTIETEAEARAIEEEARRLQQKNLKKMSAADFGFDEDEWLDTAKNENSEKSEVVTEALAVQKITADMSVDERRTIVQTRYPEYEHLADEVEALYPLLVELQKQVEVEKSQAPSGSILRSTTVIKCRALAAYLACVGMYFAILASPVRDAGSSQLLDPAELRDHPVIDSMHKFSNLLPSANIEYILMGGLGMYQCSRLWEKVRDLEAPTPAERVQSSSPIEQSPEVESVKVIKKTKKQKAAEASVSQAAILRQQRIEQAELELSGLSGLMPKSRKVSKGSREVVFRDDDDNSDFGEEEELSARAAADKARRKKSLQFYTSQVAQKANKRAGAGRDAGGDMDLPHKERLRDRQERLNAEAEARGKKLDEYGRGADLGGESDDEDAAAANDVREDEDEYYDMVAKLSKKKKREKADKYEAIKNAKAENGLLRVVEGEVDEDGKRAIGYVIEKNKGLAPKRKKDVRNPRVKKRKKYEEKKKKLSSTRAVYKGGEERGGYGGEKTGIKTGLIKSIKL